MLSNSSIVVNSNLTMPLNLGDSSKAPFNALSSGYFDPPPPPGGLGNSYSSNGILGFKIEVIFSKTFSLFKTLKMDDLLSFIKSYIYPDYQVNSTHKMTSKPLDLLSNTILYNPFERVQVYGAVQSRDAPQLNQIKAELIAAARADDPEAFLKILEDNDMKPEDKKNTDLLVFPIPAVGGFAPILYPIQYNSVKILKALKEKGYDLDTPTGVLHKTALHHAIELNTTDAFNTLLELGCSPDVQVTFTRRDGIERVKPSVRSKLFEIEKKNKRYEPFRKALLDFESDNDNNGAGPAK